MQSFKIKFKFVVKKENLKKSEIVMLLCSYLMFILKKMVSNIKINNFYFLYISPILKKKEISPQVISKFYIRFTPFSSLSAFMSRLVSLFYKKILQNLSN